MLSMTCQKQSQAAFLLSEGSLGFFPLTTGRLFFRVRPLVNANFDFVSGRGLHRSPSKKKEEVCASNETPCLVYALQVSLSHQRSPKPLPQSSAITDSSGRSPNVSVTVINEGHASSARQTNESGVSRHLLNPERTPFSLSRQASRSRLFWCRPAVLEADHVEVGELTQTVEITGVTRSCERKKSSAVVNSQDLSVPVNQRNYTRLILMMPGTSSVTAAKAGDGQSGTALFSATRPPAGQ
jgi:hypothetical protein